MMCSACGNLFCGFRSGSVLLLFPSLFSVVSDACLYVIVIATIYVRVVSSPSEAMAGGRGAETKRTRYMWRDEPQRVRTPPSGHMMYLSEHLEIFLRKINRVWVKNLSNQVNCRLGSNKRSREALEHKILLKLGPTMRFKMSVGDILAICDYLRQPRSVRQPRGRRLPQIPTSRRRQWR